METCQYDDVYIFQFEKEMKSAFIKSQIIAHAAHESPFIKSQIIAHAIAHAVHKRTFI